MDFKTVQQKLKANIAKHQMIMGKLKQNPQDKVLQSSLKEIQKQISDLGNIQKQLGKMKREDITTKSSTVYVKHENGVSNKIDASLKPTTPGFIKLEPELATQDNKQVVFRISETSNSATSTIQPSVSNTPIYSNIKEQTVVHDNAIMLKNNEFQITLKSDAIPTNSSSQISSKEVLCLSSSFDIISQKDNMTPIYTKPTVETGSKLPANNINIPKEFVTPDTSKKLVVKQPMKIRVPICTGGSIMLFPTAVVRQPVAAPMFRFTSAQQPTLKPFSGNSARLWLNIAGNQTMPRTTTFVQAPVRPPNDTTDSVGTFQKFRIVSGKATNAFNSVAVNQPNDLKLSSNHLQAVLVQSCVTSMPVNTVSTSDSRPTKIQHLAQSHCTDTQVCPTTTTNLLKAVAEKGKPLIANNVCSQSVESSSSNEKVSFLGYVDLVPREKAERIRNRRYGKRRAVAHPVYSGGLYVSTTGTDSSKRMIPAELLGMEYDETAPAKRPRGRPRGSTNKKNFLSLPTSDNEEEFLRIYKETKPEGFNAVTEKEKSADLCAICQKPGEVLLCDTCSNLYHVGCLTPPLTEVPTGMWYCDACKEKISDHDSAPAWPGIMSVVHSYVVFDGKRKESIEKAREKMKTQKSRKNQLEEQIKLLKNILKDKVVAKNLQEKNLKKNMENCEQLMSLIERIRCSVNNCLGAT